MSWLDQCLHDPTKRGINTAISHTVFFCVYVYWGDEDIKYSVISHYIVYLSFFLPSLFLVKLCPKFIICFSVKVMRSSSAKVVVLFSAEGEMTPFLRDYMMQNITGIQWVASEAWVTASVFAGSEYYPYMGGTIGFGIRKGHISRLSDYLQTVNPQVYPSNLLVKELWEALYGCSPSLSSGSQLPPCSGQEPLLEQHSAYMNTSSPRVAYNVYKAVYAIAHSLHNLLLCQAGIGPFLNNSCAKHNNIHPWQV